MIHCVLRGSVRLRARLVLSSPLLPPHTFSLGQIVSYMQQEQGFNIHSATPTPSDEPSANQHLVFNATPIFTARSLLENSA